MKTIRRRDFRPEDHPEIIFWGLDGDEKLHHEDLDECIEGILGEGSMTGVLEVVGYRRAEVLWPEPADVLARLLEGLDEEYGAEGEPTEPTAAMLAAAEAFVAVVRAEYVPWACEAVLTVQVDVATWAHHRADGTP